MENESLASSVPDARRRLGDLSHTSFYKLVKQGQLRTAKIGRRTVVLESELQRFAAALAQQAQP